MPRYDFHSPRLYVDAPLAVGQRLALDATRPTTCPTCCGSNAGEASWSSTAATANGWPRSSPGPQAARRARPSQRSAASRPACADLALPVRAAQARAPRLHGAEGGRDGRRRAAAGPDAPHAGLAGQSRAHACQCHRGRRAMRHPEPSGDRGAVALEPRSRLRSNRRACWSSATRRPSVGPARGAGRRGPARSPC